MRDTTISRGTRLLHLTSRHTDTVALFSGVSPSAVSRGTPNCAGRGPILLCVDFKGFFPFSLGRDGVGTRRSTFCGLLLALGHPTASCLLHLPTGKTRSRIAWLSHPHCGGSLAAVPGLGAQQGRVPALTCHWPGGAALPEGYKCGARGRAARRRSGWWTAFTVPAPWGWRQKGSPTSTLTGRPLVCGSCTSGTPAAAPPSTRRGCLGCCASMVAVGCWTWPVARGESKQELRDWLGQERRTAGRPVGQPLRAGAWQAALAGGSGVPAHGVERAREEHLLKQCGEGAKETWPRARV